MAYVESFYLDSNLDQEKTAVELPEDVAILNQLTEPKTQKEEVSSDYCGFESDDIPPIYRAQLRQFQKKKLIEKEEKEKSQYAYHVDLEKEKQMGEKEKLEITSAHIEHYVPGFSPPPQDEEIHKMNNFALPRGHFIVATEHVFQMKSARQNDVSQYIPLPSEDGELLNAPKKTDNGELSAMSYTDTGFSTESSVLTARLGPPYGYLPSAHRSPLATPSKSALLAEKYKGLSAFRPVSGSIESRYALPDLN